MSVVLSWELRPEWFASPNHIASFEIWRSYRFAPDTPYVRVDTPDVGWGVFEDEKNDDLEADYRVVCKNADQSTIHVIENRFIRRWKRPIRSCKVRFLFTRPDTSPWSWRRIKCCDLPSQYWVNDILTGPSGVAYAIFEYGALVRIAIEGEALAFEGVIPEERSCDFEALNGSWVMVDRRALR